MPKYDQLSNQLRIRIQQGDYALRTFPAERQLAAEHSVSYMTARRALNHLIEDGILTRAANGRIKVNHTENLGLVKPVIALLSPAFNSTGFDLWRQRISQSVEVMGGNLRQELFTHWDDPVFAESMNGFKGVFLLPSSETMPPALIHQWVKSGRPLVVLDDDLSEYGIASIRRMPPHFVKGVLKHLESQGFHRIACLNVQPLHSVIEHSIEEWKNWMKTKGWSGELINEPVKPFEQPFTQAYRVMVRRLAKQKLQADALFCVTAPAAMGAMRALHEAGIRPGHDIAVCTTDGEGLAELQIPSLTALELCDPTDFITTCIQWMLSGENWKGPLLLEPVRPELQIRESTLMVHQRMN